MKKFVQNSLLTILGLMIIGGIVEYFLRHIPNDYQYKKEFLDNNSDSIRVLFLGNSSAICAINPALISKKSFNACHNSETIDYDFEILKKYGNRLKSLECIAITISNYTLYKKLETMDPSKIKNYTIYYGINTSRKISDYSEVLSIKGITNIKRLYDYYVQNRSSITCYDLGYFIFSDLKFHYDLIETGRISALRHASKDDRYFDENLNTIKAIIEFAEKKGIKVFFYTVPAYRTFVENLDSMQLKRTINTLNDLEKKYNNVVYRNYLEDKSYSEDDFFDADHLKEMGATKFTLKIDSLINLNSELTWSKLHLSTKLREI